MGRDDLLLLAALNVSAMRSAIPGMAPHLAVNATRTDISTVSHGRVWGRRPSGPKVPALWDSARLLRELIVELEALALRQVKDDRTQPVP